MGQRGQVTDILPIPEDRDPAGDHCPSYSDENVRKVDFKPMDNNGANVFYDVTFYTE